MSLIVAHLTDDGPRIVSDSRVMFTDVSNPKIKTGTIKVIVLSKTVAACFAGDVEKGLNAIRLFAKNIVIHGLESCLTGLVDVSAEKQREVDFIVVETGSRGRLYRITDGKIESGLSSAWIGDKGAFEAFQEEFNKPLDEVQTGIMQGLPSSTKTMSKLTDAMDKVIANSKIKSVGDFNIRVGSKNDEFNYFGGTFIHLGRDIQVKDGDNLIAKLAQSVEEGGYSASIVEPACSGTAALALNFPRAKMGYLFLPLIHDEAEVIQDVLAKDFSEVILKKYGVAMSKPMLT